MSPRNSISWRHGAALPATYPCVLPDLLTAARHRAGSATVLVDGAASVDWKWLETAASRVAAALAEVIPPGARLAMMLPNGVDLLVAELAAWRLAAVAAPIWAGMGAGGAAAVKRSGAPLVITDDAAAVPPGVRHCTTAELRRLASHGPSLDQRLVSPDDPCLLQSTSGSGGAARGVLLTHRNLCSQQAAFAQMWPDLGPGDRLAGYLPWHHSFGGLAECLMSLVRGSCLTVIPGAGRDQAAFLATIAAVRPTVFQSVPKMHRVATLADVLDHTCLRWAFNAGATMGPAEERWYVDHQVPLLEGWGMTETSPSATITPPSEPRTPGCVGRPIPGVSVGICGDGHILVAGPGVMAGYDGDPVATARIIGHDPQVGRWLDSGDLGTWSEAGLQLEGRGDLSIKLANGEKVELGLIATRLEGCRGVRMAVVWNHNGTVAAMLAPLPGADDAELAQAIVEVNRCEEMPWKHLRAAWRLLEEPTIENGMLTATHKVCRNRWLACFHAGSVRRLT